MVKDDLKRRKKEFLSKIDERIGKDIGDRLSERVLKLEKFLEEEGLLTEDVRKALMSIRAKLSTPEFIGVTGKAEKEKTAFEDELISILDKNKGVLDVKSLKKMLRIRGWIFSDYSLEKTLIKLAKEGTIYIKEGFIFKGLPRDTRISKIILGEIKKLRNTNINYLAEKFGLNKKIIEIIVEDLVSSGILVRDGENIYLVG